MTELHGRVAVLTGASGGIGQALGRRLVAAGVKTAFTYGTCAAPAEQLVAEARAAGAGAVALPGDLPVGRFGRSEEVADLAMAVLRNGYLTNQVLSLDGGAYPR
ncbi:SDR family NAD(P)-dependent oxidoreductase [Nonomuraea polychroma]|uniref:SDR family NAD(P)-dependent oxidoreductase n=1 Tax=Nonomuraea polychroma TaxID=46176 RepID=UPI003D904146